MITDQIEEIYVSMSRNKLRIALTGFSIAWGIFMLIVLLGAGNGLQNSFFQGRDQFASNTMQVMGGRTSKPYDGLKDGRRISLDEKDLALTEGNAFSQYIDQVIATVSTSGTLSYGKKKRLRERRGQLPRAAEHGEDRDPLWPIH